MIIPINMEYIFAYPRTAEIIRKNFINHLKDSSNEARRKIGKQYQDSCIEETIDKIVYKSITAKDANSLRDDLDFILFAKDINKHCIANDDERRFVESVVKCLIADFEEHIQNNHKILQILNEKLLKELAKIIVSYNEEGICHALQILQNIEHKNIAYTSLFGDPIIVSRVTFTPGTTRVGYQYHL